jgi:hypothetical protein
MAVSPPPPPRGGGGRATAIHWIGGSLCSRACLDAIVYPKVSGLSHNEITTNTHWEATQSAMATKFTRLTHKIAIQLHLVAQSYTISISRSRRPVRKLLDTPSFTPAAARNRTMVFQPVSSDIFYRTVSGSSRYAEYEQMTTVNMNYQWVCRRNRLYSWFIFFLGHSKNLRL